MAYARPAKKKGMGTGAIVAIVIVAVVVVVGGLAAFGLSGAGRRLDPNATKTCRSNLKQLGLGMLMYSQDYDEVFPIEATWKDAVYPYTKNEQLLECPASRLGRDSYEMFPPLSGLGLSYIPAPAETPMVYDAGFLKGGKAPHSEGFNVTFSDGHCKAVGSSEASRYQTSSTP